MSEYTGLLRDQTGRQSGSAPETSNHQAWGLPSGDYLNNSTQQQQSYTPPQPAITSVSPGTWYTGGATSVTISGSNFGSAPTVTLSGDSYTTWTQGTASADGTKITGTVNISASDPGGETVTVTVAAGGTGNGFSAGEQQGAKSNSGTANVAAGPITIQLTYNGSPVTNGSNVYITPTPALPLSATLGPQGLSGTVSWSLAVTYASPGAYSYSPTGSVSASSAFDVGNAFKSQIGYYCGGAATLNANLNGRQAAMNFTILGQNASAATVKAQLGASPWYIQQLANSFAWIPSIRR